MTGWIWKYTEPKGGELPLGTRIKLILPKQYGVLATIVAYHRNKYRVNGSQIGYHIVPDKGFEPPSDAWVTFKEWFEVIE